MRRILLAIVAAASGWACSLPGRAAPGPDPAVRLSPSPSRFTLVTAGEVRGVVLDEWVVSSIDSVGGVRSGFVAGPRAGGWPDVDGGVGMSASWVDATRVGVPSDYYYLAANGPLLSRLTTSANCRERSSQVYLDRRPTFDPARRWSPGHFMASGDGVCRRGGQATRYAYFVAAPGFGPVHEVGIPTSGLYVVVAVVPEERGARHTLNALLHRTRFGNTAIRDFVAAADRRAA